MATETQQRHLRNAVAKLSALKFNVTFSRISITSLRQPERLRFIHKLDLDLGAEKSYNKYDFEFDISANPYCALAFLVRVIDCVNTRSMTPDQSKTARNLLGWNQETLAKKAKLSKRTVAAFESGEAARVESVESMELALESAGIRFVDTAEEVGVLLQKRKGQE